MHRDMSGISEFKSSYKVWLEFEGKRVLGKGGAAILMQIDKSQSISKAAERLGMSYRYVWNYLNEVRNIIGQPVVETFKGGKSGGGGAKLSVLGKRLLTEYNQLSRNMESLFSNDKLSEVMVMKISARNRLKGNVSLVKKDGVMAMVKLKVTEPAEITALISLAAAEDLKIKVGDKVEAIVKATEVIIAK